MTPEEGLGSLSLAQRWEGLRGQKDHGWDKSVSFNTDPSIAFGRYQEVSLLSISLYLVANSLAFLLVL